MKTMELWDIIDKQENQDCSFCLELKQDNDGNILKAQAVVADGYSSVKGTNKYLVASAGCRPVKRYKIKDEYKDEYLVDYIVNQINSTPSGTDIKIEVKKIEDQFESLYKTEWENENDFEIIWKLRKNFDASWQKFAEDDFFDWETTSQCIKDLYDCMNEIKENITDKTDSDITSGKKEPFLKEFYNIQCFKEGDPRLGYFEDTLLLLRAVVKFKINEKLICPLCDLQTRFNRLSEFAKCMGNRNKVILRSQWGRLYDCYSKEISAKTLVHRIYPRAAVIGNMPAKLKSAILEYSIQHFEKIEDFKDTKDFDYIISEKKLTNMPQEHFIRRIQSSELQDSLEKLLKYPNVIFRELCEFDMGQVTQKPSFLVNNSVIDKKVVKVYTKWERVVGVQCTNTQCHRYGTCPAAKPQPIDKWKNQHKKFCYDDEMRLVLTNLFYLLDQKKEEAIIIKDIEFNFSIIAKAIRVFCENVMLALCYVGEIPAARLKCKYNVQDGFRRRVASEFEDPHKLIVFGKNNALDYYKYYDDSKKHIIKTAVDMNECPNNETYSSAMTSIANDIYALLDFVNPEMHANGNMPTFDELENYVKKIKNISKETHEILSKKIGNNKKS